MNENTNLNLEFGIKMRSIEDALYTGTPTDLRAARAKLLDIKLADIPVLPSMPDDDHLILAAALAVKETALNWSTPFDVQKMADAYKMELEREAEIRKTH